MRTRVLLARRLSSGIRNSPPLTLVPAHRSQPSPLSGGALPSRDHGGSAPRSQSLLRAGAFLGGSLPSALAGGRSAGAEGAGGSGTAGRQTSFPALADELSNHGTLLARPAPVTQADHAASMLMQVDSRHAARAAAGFAAARGTGAGSGTAAVRGRLRAERLPWDWSLKEHVRLSSPDSLEWCSQLRAGIECEALLCSASGGALSPKQPPGPAAAAAGVDVAKALFARALQYWAYVPAPPPSGAAGPAAAARPSSLGASGGACGGAEGGPDGALSAAAAAASATYGEWVEALRSAYYLLLRGHCPYFYLQMGIGNGGGQYTILWRNAGVPACGGAEQAGAGCGADAHSLAPGCFDAPVELEAEGGLYAVMSNPGASVCETLRAADVPFTRHVPPRSLPPAGGVSAGGRRPAAQSVADEVGDPDAAAELESLNAASCAMPALSRGPSAAVAGGSSTGALAFRGAEDVHALFDMLTSSTSALSAAASRLYAPRPFLNATCRRLRVQRQGALMQRVVSGGQPGEYARPRTAGAATESVCMVELAGIVLPCALHTLCRALDTARCSEYRVRALAAERSHQLNCAFSERVEAAACDGSALAFTEAERTDGAWMLTRATPHIAG